LVVFSNKSKMDSQEF